MIGLEVLPKGLTCNSIACSYCMRIAVFLVVLYDTHSQTHSSLIPTLASMTLEERKTFFPHIT